MYAHTYQDGTTVITMGIGRAGDVAIFMENSETPEFYVEIAGKEVCCYPNSIANVLKGLREAFTQIRNNNIQWWRF